MGFYYKFVACQPQCAFANFITNLRYKTEIPVFES